MRTIQLKLLKFSELSPEAKEKACKNYRNKGYEPAWANENVKSAEEFADIFPVKINRYSYGGFDGRDGVSYEFTERDEVADLKGQRLATYIWNNYGSQLFKGKYYGRLSPFDKYGNKIPVSKEFPIGERHVKRYSKVLKDTCCVMTGYYMDDMILAPIYKFLNKPTDQTFSDLISDCFDEWTDACNKDVEHQSSDEYIGEHLEANDYEFTEEGETYP